MISIIFAVNLINFSSHHQFFYVLELIITFKIPNWHGALLRISVTKYTHEIVIHKSDNSFLSKFNYSSFDFFSFFPIPFFIHASLPRFSPHNSLSLSPSHFFLLVVFWVFFFLVSLSLIQLSNGSCFFLNSRIEFRMPNWSQPSSFEGDIGSGQPSSFKASKPIVNSILMQLKSPNVYATLRWKISNFESNSREKKRLF